MSSMTGKKIGKISRHIRRNRFPWFSGKKWIPVFRKEFPLRNRRKHGQAPWLFRRIPSNASMPGELQSAWNSGGPDAREISDASVCPAGIHNEPTSYLRMLPAGSLPHTAVRSFHPAIRNPVFPADDGCNRLFEEAPSPALRPGHSTIRNAAAHEFPVQLRRPFGHIWKLTGALSTFIL